MAKAKKKVDPFKTRKTKSTVVKESDTVTPPEEVQAAIDNFRECQEQAKHFEGESTIHKDVIMNYARDEFVKRSMNGKEKSFKILGDETMVTFVIQDSSAGMSDEDVEEFTEKWGEKAAEDLIMRDYRSIRFDPKVLEANYDAVVDCLQALPEQVLDNLFKPMLQMARPGAGSAAKNYAKDPETLLDLLSDLKIKNYIK